MKETPSAVKLGIAHNMLTPEWPTTQKLKVRRRCCASLAACLLLTGVTMASSAGAPPPQDQVTVDNDGSVRVPAFSLPLSIYMSEESKRAYVSSRLSRPVTPASNDAKTLRVGLERKLEPLLARAEVVYPVDVSIENIGGVSAHIVVPRRGIAKQNERRVLINLRGGGMRYGTPSLGLLESMPIAAMMNIKVISVDYRQAPEAHFPAASEDVTAVYTSLLRHYQASNIGLYGCSSGGQLVAMSVAWFAKRHLPPPGAIGIFCSGAEYRIGGDSAFLAAPLIPDPGARVAVPPPRPNPPAMWDDAEYLGNVDWRDPLVSPVRYPESLARFPPTLLITGTRDFAMSSVIYTQAQLVKAGVDAELHVWDGMWHSFFINVDLPESREMYTVVGRFFDAHLGK
jgi:acetyl esterase/lipase